MEIYGGILLISISLLLFIFAFAFFDDECYFRCLAAFVLFLILMTSGIASIVNSKQKSWAVDIGIAKYETNKPISNIIFVPKVAKIINSHKLKLLEKEEKEIQKEQKYIKQRISVDEHNIEKLKKEK